MSKDAPIAVLAVTVCLYWGTEVLLALYQGLRRGRSAGILPRHSYEWRLWSLIVPVVAAWMLLPCLASSSQLAWLSLPAWAIDVPWIYGLRCTAVALAVACYLLSVY